MQNKETKKIESAPKQKGYLLLVFVALGLLTVIAVVSFLFLNNSQNTTYTNATIGDEVYTLEVSDTEATRQKGLSERSGLDPNTGMLFDFAVDGDWRIWMVQMRFPIDIVWLNANKQIIFVKDNATPAEYPEVYKAEELSRYVIELPSDAVEQHNLKIGDYVSF